MPRTVDEGFRDFLPRLTPTTTESSAASKHRASIKSRLEKDFGLKRFVRIGSFGNGTSISGHSDVDYLASLANEKLSSDSSYSLRKVRESLADRFPNTEVRVSCPAVVVPFGADGCESTEVVPADFVGKIGEHKIYDIADCNGGWMRASPDAHNAYVAAIDSKLGGKVKPLIRFIKAWKFFRDVPISSFYLELRTAKYAYSEKSIVYDIDVKRILCRCTFRYLWSLPDYRRPGRCFGAEGVAREEESSLRAAHATAPRSNNNTLAQFVRRRSPVALTPRLPPSTATRRSSSSART